jgi:hypothetical protein
MTLNVRETPAALLTQLPDVEGHQLGERAKNRPPCDVTAT